MPRTLEPGYDKFAARSTVNDPGARDVKADSKWTERIEEYRDHGPS